MYFMKKEIVYAFIKKAGGVAHKHVAYGSFFSKNYKYKVFYCKSFNGVLYSGSVPYVTLVTGYVI